MMLPDLGRWVHDILKPQLPEVGESVRVIKPIDLFNTNFKYPISQGRLDSQAAYAAHAEKRHETFEAFLAEEQGR